MKGSSGGRGKPVERLTTEIWYFRGPGAVPVRSHFTSVSLIVAHVYSPVGGTNTTGFAGKLVEVGFRVVVQPEDHRRVRVGFAMNRLLADRKVAAVHPDRYVGAAAVGAS